MEKRLDLVRLLMQHGADINSVDMGYIFELVIHIKRVDGGWLVSDLKNFHDECGGKQYYAQY